MKRPIRSTIGLVLSAFLSACGGGVPPQVPNLALLAGNVNGSGSADGTGPAASFYLPSDVATDRAGNIYVADTANNTIRKITPAGVVTTFAGTAGVVGHADGTGPAASFFFPSGIATDSAGNVYVADEMNNTIRKITPAGVVTTIAGIALTMGHANGPGATATFNGPQGVATDSAGNVFVADTGNSTIRQISPFGTVSTVAGIALTVGHADGQGTLATFFLPRGLATDSLGNVYVADTGNNVIRKITPPGVVSTLAGTALTVGSADGTGPAASFNGPQKIATDSAGNVYVADTVNSTIRKITAGGLVTTIVGQPGIVAFMPGKLPGELALPHGAALSGRTLYTTSNNTIVQITNSP